MMEETESVSGRKRVLFVKKQSLCQKKIMSERDRRQNLHQESGTYRGCVMQKQKLYQEEIEFMEGINKYCLKKNPEAFL
jgi:hypothetical protein